MNHVTLNSLLVADVQNRIGRTVNSVQDLNQLIKKMRDDSDFYQKLNDEQYEKLKDFANALNEKENDSLESVIEKELEKV